MDDVLIRFRLVGDEAQALRELSSAEMRTPREQTRYLVRRELLKRGLLPSIGQSDHQQTQAQEATS